MLHSDDSILKKHIHDVSESISKLWGIVWLKEEGLEGEGIRIVLSTAMPP